MQVKKKMSEINGHNEEEVMGRNKPPERWPMEERKEKEVITANSYAIAVNLFRFCRYVTKGGARETVVSLSVSGDI